ncbi:MAG: MarP family serine protease, partial [Solirubrobacteraceae bacterium]
MLVAFIAVLAFYGYAQGFIVGALSLAGFVVGAFVGTRVAPLLLHQG